MEESIGVKIINFIIEKDLVTADEECPDVLIWKEDTIDLLDKEFGNREKNE